VTAEDVVFSFKNYNGGNAEFLKNRIEKLEAVNPYLFRLAFKGPFPDFFNYLLPGGSTIAWVVPKKYIEKVGEAGFKRHPVGCGPYKFVEFMPGVRMVGEAFEEYWRKVPNIKRIEVYFVQETSARFAKIKTGEVDIASSLHGVLVDQVKKDPKLTLAGR